MANTSSAKKRVRRDTRRTEVNRARRGRIRTFVKRVETAIESNDKEAAQVAFVAAEPEIMRGVTRGVLHRNAASRKVSRLAARIKSL